MKAKSKCPCVSVLVPIYNVEKYLRQCLSSIQAQTLRDIEIICINDGSTDGSLAIVKEFQKNDERFVLIDKKNSGYGDSMNQGLKKARGEYIGIVESDDWVEERKFEDLYGIAKANDAEVVRANFFHYRAGNDLKIPSIPPHETDRLINPSHHTWLFLQSPAVWASIYKRNFLQKNGIEFLPTPGASYQDTSFAFKVWAAAKRVCLTTEAYLHYRTDNENSSINHPGKVFCVCDEYAEIEKYLRQNNQYDDLGLVMWTAKCYIYLWNALRLKPKLVREFYKKVTPEVQVANEEGLIFLDFFEDAPIARITQALVVGRIGRACRLVRREQRKMKRLRRLEDAKTRPYRTKEMKIAQQITKLEAQNDALDQKIRNLEQKLEVKHASN